MYDPSGRLLGPGAGGERTADGRPVLDRRLGRVYSPDPRDRSYAIGAGQDGNRRAQLLRAVEARPEAQRTNPWRLGRVLDQRGTSECVLHAIAQFLQSAPIMSRPDVSPEGLTRRYRAAQRRDEWPGEEPAYYGTSARAGLDVYRAEGVIGGYVWLTDLEAAKLWVRTRGPLLLGCDWFAGLSRPDKTGRIRPEGQWLGGHEIMVRWRYADDHRTKAGLWELVNSWGPGWGDKGRAYLSDADFAYLAFQLGGDLAGPTEVKLPKPAQAAQAGDAP